MSKTTAAITGVMGYVPDDILNNKDLSQIVDTTDEWIMTRIGIKERHIQKGMGKGTSDMCKEAGRNLLEKTNTKPEDIDLVLCATVTPDMVFPATANIICDKLGLTNAFAFDINAGCSGFLYTLDVAAKYIESGTCKKVLVFGSDNLTKIVDYEDRQTCPIFGDASGVVLLEPDTEGYGVVDSILRSDGVGRRYLHLKAGGSIRPASYETIDKRQHYIYQEGQPVFKFAVSRMADVSVEMMKKHDISPEELAWLVPHQANMRIIEATAKRMGISPDQVMINIQRYGNTTAATLPLCLWEWEDKLKKGDKIILSAFGAGFTWGAIYLRWAYDPK